MAKQQILFGKDKENYARREAYTLRLPKMIQHVSPFEMQFGMKQPAHYNCRRSRKGNLLIEGEETVSIPGYTDNIRL